VGEEGSQFDVLLAGVGAVEQSFQFIQEIIILILQRPALGQMVLGVDEGEDVVLEGGRDWGIASDGVSEAVAVGLVKIGGAFQDGGAGRDQGLFQAVAQGVVGPDLFAVISDDQKIRDFHYFLFFLFFLFLLFIAIFHNIGIIALK
jgi:hypothetical protein